MTRNPPCRNTNIYGIAIVYIWVRGQMNVIVAYGIRNQGWYGTL